MKFAAAKKKRVTGKIANKLTYRDDANWVFITVVTDFYTAVGGYRQRNNPNDIAQTSVRKASIPWIGCWMKCSVVA